MGGLFTFDYVQSLLTEMMLAPDRLLKQDRYNIVPYFQKGYSGLGRDRGQAVSYGYKLGCDKIFLIDSDQSWKWTDVVKLLESVYPIVAGVVPLKQKNQVLNYTVMERDWDTTEDEDKKVTANGLRRLRQKYHGQDEIQVEMTGAAFMCIDRVAIEAIIKNGCEEFMFYDPHSQSKQIGWDLFPSGPLNKVYFGEDWGFCMNAKRAGIPIHINSTVLIPHIGSYTYTIDPREVGL